MQRLYYLVAGALVAGGTLALVGGWLWPGLPIPLYSTVGVLLCLVPTVLTYLWAGWARSQSAEQQLLMVLGGTGLRMFVVLLAGLVLYYSRPEFHRASFWIVILVLYLLTLALEVAVLLPGRGGGARQAGTGATEPLGQTES